MFPIIVLAPGIAKTWLAPPDAWWWVELGLAMLAAVAMLAHGLTALKVRCRECPVRRVRRPPHGSAQSGHWSTSAPTDQNSANNGVPLIVSVEAASSCRTPPPRAGVTQPSCSNRSDPASADAK